MSDDLWPCLCRYQLMCSMCAFVEDQGDVGQRSCSPVSASRQASRHQGSVEGKLGTVWLESSCLLALRSRRPETTARTDGEKGTLTVPSKILPPRSAPGKNHENPSLFDLTALQDTSSTPSTARQQAQKRVFMQKEYDSCRGNKPAFPPTSSTSLPCCA